MASRRIERQSYSTVFKEKNIEIRHYPPATLATIHSPAATYGSLASSGFRRLANFIFGSNSRNEKIAMTSPVHMDINAERSSMSFVMPSKYSEKDLPKPIDSGVLIEESGEETVAAIRFSGFASNERLKRFSKRLEDWLRENNIPFSGSFRYLGYDPPYRVFGRRNEMIVTVDWREK